MFLHRHMTVADEPDVRPMINLLYTCFRTAGAQPIEAAEVAIGLVIQDLTRTANIGVMNEKILEYMMIMEAMIDEATRFNQIVKRRSRILFWMNVCTACVIFLLLLHTFFWHH